MIRRLLLYFSVAFLISLSFSSVAEARLDEIYPGEPYGPTSIGVCKTAYATNTAGTCGTSCPDVCASGAMDSDKCWQVISPQIGEWGEYDLKEKRNWYPDPDRGGYWDYGYSASYTATRVCSIGDKRDPSGDFTQLYAGSCSCTEGTTSQISV